MANVTTEIDSNRSEFSQARERAAILAVAPAMPANYVDQPTLAARLRRLWADRKTLLRRFDDLQSAVMVEGRHLALPMSEYEPLDTFAKRNRRWREIAAELGCAAVSDALAQAGVSPDEVDHFLFTTDTGISTPNIEALVINRLGLNARIKRTPLFGLGCAGEPEESPERPIIWPRVQIKSPYFCRWSSVRLPSNATICRSPI
jgi:predicted naringenin-chalcone synthase